MVHLCFLVKNQNIMTSFSKRLMPTQNNSISEGSRIMVAVRVIHHRKTGYIPIGVDVGITKRKDGKILPNWMDGMVSQSEPEWIAKNQAIEDFYNKVLEKYSHVINPGLMSVGELIRHLSMCDRNGNMATLGTVMEDYLEDRKGSVSEDYRLMVRRSVNRMTDWLRGDMALASLVPEAIKEYMTYLRKGRKTVIENTPYYSARYHQVRYRKEERIVPLLSEASINKELSHIKAVINFAIEEGAVRYDTHPFAKVEIRRSGARETDVSPEAIRAMRDALPDCQSKILARDVFMLSFYTGGMNYKDILAADWSDDVVIYCREKTKNRGTMRRTVKIPVLPEARKILDRYVQEGRWCSGLKYKNSRDEIGYIGKRLALLVRDLGLPSYMTFYSARKSFAQFALDIGISDAVTDYLMGHSGNGRGVISYYSRVTPRMAGIALRKVIDYMQDPEQFTEQLEAAVMG